MAIELIIAPEVERDLAEARPCDSSIAGVERAGVTSLIIQLLYLAIAGRVWSPHGPSQSLLAAMSRIAVVEGRLL
jgi:hypothetical protein